LFTPLLVGGVVLALTQGQKIRRFFRTFFGTRPENPARPTSLSVLRATILGNDKSSVARALGPPRTAILQTIGIHQPTRQASWQADTWYYPLQRGDHGAIAIQFRGNIARKVEFIQVPVM
jgi:hypothetical protein